MSNRIANPQSRVAAVRTALFPFSFLLFLALCLAAIPARAANALITSTVSPNIVSNTYNGIITLQINGLTNGANTVVVQKFLDVNTNGIIDSSDLLVQQFRLSVGQTNVFTDAASGTPVTVTNFMPSDASSSTNQMIVPLNFQNGDFAQSLIGQYLYKFSSPSNQFSPVTNLFVVTNSFYSTYVTGSVVTANSISFTPTNVPNAIVLLCLNQSGPLVVQAGTVADKFGNFSLRVAPGNYLFAAAKTNFVSGDITNQLAAKTTNSSPYDIPMFQATTNITGRVIDSVHSNGLAGVSGIAVSTNGLLSFYFTDTNGYFYTPVVTNFWQAPVDMFAAAFQGYLTWQSNQTLNVSNKVVNITNALPPVSAIFYGTVSNTLAPMPDVYVYAADNAGHQSIGMTDTHGKYVVGVSAGTNQWRLYIPPTDNPGITNQYVINPLYVQTAGLQTNQAVQVNFGLEQAFYTISGTVSNDDGQPIPGAVVFADNTNGYQAFSATTASPDGTYTLNVSSGSWTVGVTPESLEGLGYTNVADFPTNDTVSVSDADPNATANFSFLVCGEIAITVTNLADGIEGEYYETNLEGDAKSCQPVTSWAAAYGITLTSLFDSTNVIYTNGTAIYADSKVIGYLETEFGVTNVYDPTNGLDLDQPFFINCSGTPTQVGSGWQFDNVQATVSITGPITNTTTVTINGQNWTATATTQNGSTFSTTLNISALPSSSGDYYVGSGWYGGVGAAITKSGTGSNKVASVLGAFRSIPAFGNSMIAASSIPYTNLDNTVVFIAQGGHVGQYTISAYGPQTNNLDGLSLASDGLLSGIPSTNGTFNFSVMAEDANSDITVQPLSLFILPATAITGPSLFLAAGMQSSNTFQMRLTGLNSNLDYTVLMSTNLASPNWVPIYTTNNPTTNVLTVPDTAATNAARYYRIQISQ